MTEKRRLLLAAVNLDCDDAAALARFYSRVTGLPVDPRSGKDFAAIRTDEGVVIGFQRVDPYQRPDWPGSRNPQQLHLDFEVEDVAAAALAVLSEGATEPAVQPGGDRWKVLLDPAGHPFCLTPLGSH